MYRINSVLMAVITGVGSGLAWRSAADTVRLSTLRIPVMSEQSPVNAFELKADQALGMVSFGLMQRLAKDGQVELPWLETAVDSDVERARQLRQRLELTALAIKTGAPLTTAEVSLLLGARPGSEQVERGGLVAHRVSRNVWRLSKLEKNDRTDRYDGFRRRL
uniref:Uncharacterized protein n=1 Tax=uncultured marine type-A Synechococcus GOM 5D20 TaxID=364154 RepID=Q0QK62_9SYNE|nr:unknown [uncultured marine type-A Synechococcus GOM 5D20]